MIPTVLEILLDELAELDDELAEVESTMTSVEYDDALRLTRRERRGVLRVLETRRIEVLAETALALTALDAL